MTLRWIALVVMSGALVTGCSRKSEEAEHQAAAASAVVEPMPTDGASMPTTEPLPTEATALPTDGAAPTTTALPSEFDANSVPLSSASLPPFPFFKDPEGQENFLKGSDALKPFDRHYFIAGNKLVTQEGKVAFFGYNLEYPPSGGRVYTALEFLRNYDVAITSLGGQKISSVQFSEELLKTVGGREVVEKYWNASPPVPDSEQYTYLIRTPSKEYWVHVSAGGSIPLMGRVVVLEKQAMQTSLGFLDAAAMKKELDAKGRVALYINFDTDKATLRPDAQPIIDEIHKLLTSEGSLKLSIEGHTDSTGGADHNRQLSAARARSVFGALVGLGADPGRLTSKGFGPDKPIADNSTDDGRAKNRRVELVKTN
jgi:OmpA-OmpF porin, OOP family